MRDTGLLLLLTREFLQLVFILALLWITPFHEEIVHSLVAFRPIL